MKTIQQGRSIVLWNVHVERIAEGLHIHVDEVKEILYDYVKKALIEFHQWKEGEAKLTLIMSSMDQCIIHIVPYIEDTTLQQGVQVEVQGYARHDPHTKSTNFVQQRQSLQKKHLETHELILQSMDGKELIEGTSSNFFVIQSRNNQWVIQTAPLNLVLVGSILQLVIHSILPVEFSAPKVSECKEWSGVYICSTSRNIVPVEKLVLVDGEMISYSSKDLPVFHHLNQSVANQLRKESTIFIEDD